MVSASAVVALVVLLAVNTAVAALVTRYCRFQLETQWGAAIFVVVLVPVVYVATTTVVGAVLGAGLFDGAGSLVMVTWLLPFGLGVAIDLFWMPAPDEVELPASGE